jgi:hypothetical protein
MKQGARPGEDKEEVYEEGEDESDEEDEGEDEEPKLKYQRLGFSVLEILKDDSATCMHVHEKFLVRSYSLPRSLAEGLSRSIFFVFNK